MDSGLDMHVVHTEVDYVAPVRWRDAVRVAVTCEHVGTTSFTIGFSVLRRRDGSDEPAAVRGRNVYVIVSTDDWAKRPVPDHFARRCRFFFFFFFFKKKKKKKKKKPFPITVCGRHVDYLAGSSRAAAGLTSAS